MKLPRRVVLGLISSVLIGVPAIFVAPGAAQGLSDDDIVFSLTREDMDGIGDEAVRLIGAVYGAAIAPTEIESSVRPSGNLISGRSSLTIADALDQTIIEVGTEISDSVFDQLAGIAERLAYRDPQIHDDGYTEFVSISLIGVEVVAQNELEISFKVQIEERMLYSSGVEGLGVVEFIVSIAPDTHEILSIRRLWLDDYVDSSSKFESSSDYSFFGEPATFSDNSTIDNPLKGGFEDVANGVSAANKAKIVTYATTYAYNYNPAYRSFDADCTNFVSQAMKAGGWAETGITNSNSNWWYNALTQSYTWAGAENWFDFARNQSKRATVITNLYSVVPGDVVQMKYSGQTAIGHSMVVTKKDADGTVYVSYHSTNQLNKKLSELVAAYPGATFYAHGI